MALILCIETATDVCSVAIAENDKVLILEESNTANSHASQLNVLVEKALSSLNITINNLDAIAVSKGPGSYTGLRIGVSSAKGFCYALNKPLIAVETLRSLAWGFVSRSKAMRPNAKIIPMLDARRMEVYCAVYDQELNEVEPVSAKIIDENSFADLLSEGDVYLIGNGATKCKSKLDNGRTLFIDDIKCSAAFMAKFVFEAYQQKSFEDVAYFEPYYLKDFVGTIPKNKM